MGRDRRNFTDEFKQQMISLFNNGKPRNEIIKEYDLTPSALNNWIKRFNSSGPFKIDGSRTDEEKRLLQLEKENQ